MPKTPPAPIPETPAPLAPGTVVRVFEHGALLADARVVRQNEDGTLDLQAERGMQQITLYGVRERVAGSNGWERA